MIKKHKIIIGAILGIILVSLIAFLALNKTQNQKSEAPINSNISQNNIQSNSTDSKTSITLIDSNQTKSKEPQTKEIKSVTNTPNKPIDSKIVYYTGYLGGKPIHLVYWSNGHQTDSQTFFDGQYTYDDISTKPLDLSISFSSGGIFSAEESVKQKITGRFTSTEGLDLDQAMKLENDRFCLFPEDPNTICGLWQSPDKSNTEPFIINPSDPFILEDSLKKASKYESTFVGRERWHRLLGWDQEIDNQSDEACGSSDYTFDNKNTSNDLAYSDNLGYNYKKSQDDGGVTVYKVSNGNLVSVFCQLGPYWNSERWYFIDQNLKIYPQLFDLGEGETDENGNVINIIPSVIMHGSWPTYDEKTRILSTTLRSSNIHCDDSYYEFIFKDKNFEKYRSFKIYCNEKELNDGGTPATAGSGDNQHYVNLRYIQTFPESQKGKIVDVDKI